MVQFRIKKTTLQGSISVEVVVIPFELLPTVLCISFDKKHTGKRCVWGTRRLVNAIPPLKKRGNRCSFEQEGDSDPLSTLSVAI